MTESHAAPSLRATGRVPRRRRWTGMLVVAAAAAGAALARVIDWRSHAHPR